MMGQLSATSPRRRRVARPWPRLKRRQWARPNDLAGMVTLFAVIPSLPRAELARLAGRMIDRRDEIDGDPDLEDPHADDEDTHDREQEENHE